MSQAYVDTSWLVAIELAEPAAATLIGRLASFERLISSPLLEAELLAVLAREQRKPAGGNLASIDLVFVDRALTAEINTVLRAGYVRGADCWHLATALFASPDPVQLSFLTLDTAQLKVARALGFPT